MVAIVDPSAGKIGGDLVFLLQTLLWVALNWNVW